MAAAATAGRGAMGWVILVAALSVPGVLFFNWWSHLKGEREKAVATKARDRVPDANVFQSSPNPSKLVNPMAAPAAAAVSSAAAEAPVTSNMMSQEALLAAAGFEAKSAPAAEAPAAATATAAASLARDPMLSPFDRVRLKEEENNKRLAQLRLEEAAAASRRRPARREINPATLIDLQGIVSNAGGESKAIVNNEVVGVGETIAKCRVVRITSAGVTFDYKGRRFTKSVNRE